MDSVQNVELVARPRDESTKSLHDYLSNNNYRNLIAFSLIFMFSLVFYLIYLLVDALIDKQKHYELCVKSYERYEKRCRAKKSKIQQQQQQHHQLQESDQKDINKKMSECDEKKMCNEIGNDEDDKEIGIGASS